MSEEYTLMTSRECGVARHKMRFRIREHLDRKGLSLAEVARRVGVTAEAIGRTVNGYNHSPKILNELRELGVPEKYLYDPRRQVSQESGVKVA